MDSYEGTVSFPTYISFEEYKHDFKQFVLSVLRDPSVIWKAKLPYSGFTTALVTEMSSVFVELKSFLYECFSYYAQRRHEEARNEIAISGGFIYRKISDFKRKLADGNPVWVTPVASKKKKSRVSHKPNKKCNRMTAAERKMNAYILGRFGGDHVHKRAPKFPLFQSGGRPISFAKIVPKTTHEERDVQQSKVAAKRASIAYKSLPKHDREMMVKDKRDKRVPKYYHEQDGPDYQGGNIVKVVSSILVSFAAGTACAATAFCARKANNVLEEANKLIKAIRAFTNNPVWMIPVACIACFFIGKTVFRFAFQVLCNVMARFFPSELWKALSPHVAEVVMQDGSNVIGKVMAVTCVFSIFKGLKFDHRTMTEFIKRMSVLPRLTESLSTFSEWISIAFETVINFFRGLFGKDAISLRLTKATQLDAWTRKVEVVLLQHQTLNVVPSPETIDSWLSLIGEAHELREIYRGTPMYRNVCELYDRLLTVIKPYKGSINARNNFRVEPEMILLTGAPGIGKTVLTMWLCATILKRSRIATGDSKSILREIWQKGCSEYWNGYAGQKALIIDDAFQMHGDKTDKDNDFINVIRSISSWAFPLNFADVESKGAIYFTSQLVVATTNRNNLQYGADMIYDMGAVYRRIGHGYSLKLNPDFSLPDGKLDIVKMKAAKSASPPGTFPWHIWSLEKHDFQTGMDMNIHRSLEEVVEEISQSLIRKNVSHAAELDDLAEYIDTMEEITEQPIMQAGGEFPVNKKVLFWRNQDDVLNQQLQFRVLTDLDESVLGFTDWLSSSFLAKGWKMYKGFQRAVDNHINKLLCKLPISAQIKGFLFKYLRFVARFMEFQVLFAGAKFIVNAVVGIIKAILGNFWPQDDSKGEVVEQSNVKTPITKVNNIILQNGSVDVVNNVEANCYYMVCHVKGESTMEKMGTGIFVCDSLLIFPEHFDKTIRRYENGDVYFVNRKRPEFNFSVPVVKFMAQKSFSKDEITYMCMDGVRAHRNITKSFLAEKDLKYCAGKPASLWVCDVDATSSNGVLSFSKKDRVFESSTVAWKPLGATFATMKLPRFFQYLAATQAGHCGSPLITNKSSLFGGASVMGVHIAGDSWQKAYSVPVTADMLEEARKKLSIIDDKFFDDLTERGISHQVGDEFHILENTSMLPLCKLDLAIPMAQKSNFFKTQYFDIMGPCDLLPARQRPYFVEGVQKFPMLNALAPYNTPVNLFEDHFDDLVHVSMSKFSAISRDAPRHVMDFETAILGEPRLEYFRSIPRGTAAGFPYSIQFGSGKKAFFGDDIEYDLTSSACVLLRERVEYIIKSARDGQRLSHVFTDFLKDELRSSEKVEAGKTRLISASPLDYTIAFRMYFGCFMASVMKHHIFSGMAPGVCVFTEWDSVLREITSMGDKVCAGDFKAFDCSEQPPLHWAILRFVNKWYNDGNDIIRTVLWLELVHSRHLGGPGNDQRYIYQWNHSLPSGHPFTTIVNSIYSLCALVYAVTKSLSKPYNVFWSIANALTYGDDNLLNASSEVVHSLPVQMLADQMSKLGLTYTSDSKGAVLEDWRDASKVTFLKRGFLRSDGRVNAPLDLDSFLYTFYYCKNKKLESDIFIDVMENALEELSMHEQAIWDKFAPRVYELLSEKSIPRAPCQRLSYLEIIKMRSDNWF